MANQRERQQQYFALENTSSATMKRLQPLQFLQELSVQRYCNAGRHHLIVCTSHAGL